MSQLETLPREEEIMCLTENKAIVKSHKIIYKPTSSVLNMNCEVPMIFTETNLPRDTRIASLADLILQFQQVVSGYAPIVQEPREVILNKLVASKVTLDFSFIELNLNNFLQAIEAGHITYGKTTEKRLLESFLSRIGLKICDGGMDLIEDEDVIEVYDINSMQIYRGFGFFSTTSYSLTDLLTHEWWHLFERNPFTTKQLGDLAMKMFVTDASKPLLLDLPNHFAREIWSPSRAECLMKHKAFIPIFDSMGKTRALVNLIRVMELQFNPIRY